MGRSAVSSSCGSSFPKAAWAFKNCSHSVTPLEKQKRCPNLLLAAGDVVIFFSSPVVLRLVYCGGMEMRNSAPCPLLNGFLEDTRAGHTLVLSSRERERGRFAVEVPCLKEERRNREMCIIRGVRSMELSAAGHHRIDVFLYVFFYTSRTLWGKWEEVISKCKVFLDHFSGRWRSCFVSRLPPSSSLENGTPSTRGLFWEAKWCRDPSVRPRQSNDRREKTRKKLYTRCLSRRRRCVCLCVGASFFFVLMRTGVEWI